MTLNSIGTLFLVLGLTLPAAVMVHPAVKSDAITAVLSPAHPTVGVTKISITGTASPGATVTDTSTFPDGTVHVFSFKAEGDAKYTDGPFVLQQLGTFHDVLQDRATGASTTISYIGLGDFSVAADTTSREVAKGQTASYTVTFTSVAGFEGAVVPTALNGSHIPGTLVWWSEPSVVVPTNGAGSATLIIRTSTNTPAGTYRNIALQGANGSVTHASPSRVSLTVH